MTLLQMCRSAVPVGWINSTAIAEPAAAATGKIQTVCLAFEDYLGTEADEALLAEETARLQAADHQTVRMSRDDVMAAWATN